MSAEALPHVRALAIDNRRRMLGTRGEDLAAGHFSRLGFSVIARNVRTRYGEIDLIAHNESVLVFVEVKTRRVSNRRRDLPSEDQPLAWLTLRQRMRLRRLACAWLHENGRSHQKAHTIRFDAVGVLLDDTNKLLRLDHIEGAW